MFDRHLLRDAAFAVLLGLPTLALARPQAAAPTTEAHQPIADQAAIADQDAAQRRFSLPADA